MEDAACDAYQYETSQPKNCLLIQENATLPHAQTFFPSLNASLHKKGSVLFDNFYQLRKKEIVLKNNNPVLSTV